MKFIFFTFVTLLFVNLSISQDHKFQLGINFSPDVAFRSLSGEGNMITSVETPKMSYTTGASFVYNLTEKIGLETGLQYTNKGYGTESMYSPIISPTMGYIGAVEFNYIYSYHYLAIPLKANFLLGNKKVKFIGSIGVDTWLFLNATKKTIQYVNNNKDMSSRTIEEVEFRKINISPIISAGIDWKLSEKLNLRIEPNFKYGLIKTTYNSQISDKLHSTGVNFALYYGL